MKRSYLPRIIASLLLLCLFLVTAPLTALAQVLGDTTATQQIQVSLSSVQSSQNIIGGKLSLKNVSKETIYDAFYVVEVLGKPEVATETLNGKEETVMKQGALITYHESKSFTLEAGKSITEDIKLPFSPNIAPGSYTINVFVYIPNNSSLIGAGSQAIMLAGGNNYVAVDYGACRVVVDGIAFRQNEGPLVKNDQEAVIRCSVTNRSLRTLQIKPQLTYAERFVVGVNSTSHQSTTLNQTTQLAPNQTVVIEAPLPKIPTPQVYEALLQFVDGGGFSVSGLYTFRWIVPGASGYVRDVSLDKRAYKNGDTAKVTTTTAGSMDMYWRAPEGKGPGYSLSNGTQLKKGIVEAVITDENNNVCGRNTIPVEESTDYVTKDLSVSIQRECLNPNVVIQVKDGDKTLASLNQQYDSIPENDQASKTAGTFDRLVLGVVAILLLIGGVLVYLIRKGKIKIRIKNDQENDTGKKETPPSVPLAILLFLTAGLFFLLQTHGADMFLQKVFAERVLNGSRQSESWISSSRSWQDGTGSTDENGNPTGDPIADSQGVRVNGWQNATITPSSIACDTPVDTVTLKIPINIDRNFYTICGNEIKDPLAKLKVAILLDGQLVDRNNILVANSGGYGTMANPFRYEIASGYVVTVEIKTTGLNLSDGKKHTIAATIVAFAIHGYSRYNEQIFLNSTDNSENNEPLPFKTGENCGNADFRNTRCHGIVEKELISNCPTATPTPTPVPACNTDCVRAGDCTGDAARDGCTACLPNVDGTGKTCQKQACNSRCETRDDCAADAVKNGNTCSECVADASGVKTCQPAPTPTPTPVLRCNMSCNDSSECALGVDGCTVCVPNDTGTGGTCKAPPACGTSCTKDAQCAGARDGCNLCNAGKCSAFSENMCGCDGMDFTVAGGGTTFFPGSDVSFIAYGSVPGKDWKGSAETAVTNAQITSMKFSLYQSKLTDPNTATRLAQSAAITPEIVENSGGKVRYKVTWNQKIPSTVPSGSLFRVQADITCSAKPGVLGAATAPSTNYYADVVSMIKSVAANTKSVLQATTEQQQQATSFFPGAKISEKSCKIIKFYFE